MFACCCTKLLPLAQNWTTGAQCNPCATALASLSRLPPLLPRFKFTRNLLAICQICNGFATKRCFQVH